MLKIYLRLLHIRQLRLPGAVNLDVLHIVSLQITLTVPELVDPKNWVNSSLPYSHNLLGCSHSHKSDRQLIIRCGSGCGRLRGVKKSFFSGYTKHSQQLKAGADVYFTPSDLIDQNYFSYVLINVFNIDSKQNIIELVCVENNFIVSAPN